MKTIGKTESGKTTFVCGFVEFSLGYIENINNAYFLLPTFNQIEWDRIRKNLICIDNIDEIIDVRDSIIVCDDMQIQLKGNKILTEMILNKRHRESGIIQCEQYT